MIVVMQFIISLGQTEQLKSSTVCIDISSCTRKRTSNAMSLFLQSSTLKRLDLLKLYGFKKLDLLTVLYVQCYFGWSQMNRTKK